MRKALYFLLILVITLSTSGCHVLRRKFVRKKHADDEPPVYVSFKEYPTRPTREAYIDYYDFLTGWIGQLIQTLEEGEGQNSKRQRRAINQAIKNLDQMMYFYNPEGKVKADEIKEKLVLVKEEIDKESTSSSIKRNYVIRTLRKVERELLRNFTYSKAEKKWFNPE